MPEWTSDTVIALAPDAGSASAGQSLASMRKWESVGASDRAIWGLCQGSGKDPYQARVDLSEPAFKCSCPSRKFPCKHGIGLLLLFAKEPAHFTKAPEPAWVSEWLDSRGERAAKKAEKAQSEAEKPIDKEAQAKRAAKREERVLDGVAECRTWLDDLLRQGLASLQRSGDANEECRRVASRMVDAQAPGLASYIARIPSTLASGPGSERRTLECLSRLHLLLTAAARLGELPPALALDVRTALGFTQSKEEALAGPGVSDQWFVLGQTFSEDDRLTTRRTWLWGMQRARPALILDFAVAGQPMDNMLAPGMCFEGEVAYFPSGAPLRALLRTRNQTPASAPLSPLSSTNPAQAHSNRDVGSIEWNLTQCARALASVPWLARWPMVLNQARIARVAERCVILQHDATLPLANSFENSIHFWRLLAASRAEPCTIALEWDGVEALPIGVFTDQPAATFISLTPRWSA